MQVNNILFGLDFYNGNLENIKKDLQKKIKNGEKARVYTPNVDHIINIKSSSKVEKE